jgi:CRP-like cAMP-binding protein
MDARRLRVSPLFEGLTDADIERCAGWFEETTLTAGSRVVNEGDHSYRFYVVLAGELEVRHEFEQVRRLGPGDFFGELGVLGGGRRTAKVLAVTRCSVANIVSWDFRTMLAEYPVIAGRVEAVAVERRRHEEALTSGGSEERGESSPTATEEI